MHRRLLAALTLAVMLGAGPAFAQSCEKYEPAVVELTGTLFMLTAYGPPNYGENPDTDSLETVPVLQLNYPICVNEDPASELNVAEADIGAVQLIAPVTLRNLVGRRVKASGTLSHAVTGHDRTIVLLDASSVEIAPTVGEEVR